MIGRATAVVVVDYGVGNLHSVVKALRHEGAEVEVSSNPAALSAASRLVLPGVGAFGDGMRGLQDRSLVQPLRDYAASGRPLLGICLGMQLLLSESEEFGHHPGLDLIAGRVVALAPAPGAKVPHVGWDRVRACGEGRWLGTPLEGTPDGEGFYFVHSFAPVPADPAHALCKTLRAAGSFVSALHSRNIIGVQFHPEKSGPAGLALIRRFLATPTQEPGHV